MIRQIVVEMGEGKPDRVGVLLASADLSESFMAGLGARIVRTLSPDLGHANGCIDGVRWRWMPMDGETPGLEYQTIRVTPKGPTHQEILELERLLYGDTRLECPGIRATGDPAAAAPPSDWGSLVDLAPPPCDRLPWWVWVVAVAIVIGAFIAGVRADG